MEELFNILGRKVEVHNGPIFYNVDMGKCCQIREVTCNGLFKISMSDFYNDAKTTISTAIVSQDYVLENFISAEPADKCPFIKFDNVGFRAQQFTDDKSKIKKYQDANFYNILLNLAKQYELYELAERVNSILKEL